MGNKELRLRNQESEKEGGNRPMGNGRKGRGKDGRKKRNIIKESG